MKEREELIITTYSNALAKTKKVTLKFFRVLMVGLGLLFTGLFLTVFFGTLGLYFKYSAEFAKIKPQSNSTQLVMYDKDGGEIFRGYGAAEPNRVKLADIPEDVKKATLAAEDLEFYNHGPIYLKGLARAAYVNWQNSKGSGIEKLTNLFSEGNYSQGGSTITQQLVKNVYLTSEKSFERKIKEAVFSSKLEEKYSKDQILEMYLNEIYYGEQALGIKNAARVFFDKDLSQLDLAESSMLAGLPQAPTYYDPLGVNYLQAKKRQEYVLQQMLGAKMITLEQAKAAANEPLTLVGKVDSFDKYPYFSQYVKDELATKLGEDNISEKGLKVYTSLDPKLQAVAEQQVKEKLVTLSYKGASNAAAVVADPKTSTILAMVGGADWNTSKVNVATSERQPGSSFKPLVYATALENGYSAASILVDKYLSFGSNPTYSPKNYSGGYSGYLTVRNALARSLNTTAVEMGKLVGLEKVIDTAHRLGISSLNSGPDNYGLPLSLGSGEVKLVDMVEAFSTFADGGKRAPQSAILSIKNNRGDTVTLPTRVKNQVISEETAYIISSILSDNNARSVTFGSVSPLKTDKTTAVKTGTTDNYSDSWTMGYSPDYVVGVWMGNNDHAPMKNVSGVEGAAYVWHDIMTAALADKADTPFPKPANIKQAWVNPYTGALATWQGSPNILEYFKEGTIPTTNPDRSYLKEF